MMHLNLVFPQWQGAGSPVTLYRGAGLLAEALELSEPQTVPVAPEEPLRVEQDILGRGSILRHLRLAREVLERHQPRTILTLGGDCGVEIAPISYLNAQHEGMGLVWLDAHADLNTPESSPSKTFHGMPLRLLMGEGDAELLALSYSSLTPPQVLLAGIRDLDPPEKDFIEQHALTCLSAADLAGGGDRLRAAVSAAGFTSLYVHLDLDILDPARFPAVGYPCPGGLTVAELTELLAALTDTLPIVGFGLTEFAPTRAADLEPLRPLLEQCNYSALLAP